MVYRTGIPSINNRVTLSAAQFKQNYREMQRYLSRDHVPWNDPDNKKRGYHKVVTLPDQGGDPTTAAGVIALYANGSSPTELYTRNESDGSVQKVYSNGYAVNGLALEAYVAFDPFGDILKVERSTNNPDDPGETEEVALATSNVTVTKPDINIEEYTISFSPSLSTDNYHWVIDQRCVSGIINANVQIQVENNATYSNVVSKDTLKLKAYRVDSTGGAAPVGVLERVVLQIYTGVS